MPTGNASADVLFEVRVGEKWSDNARRLLRSRLGLTETVHGSTYSKVARAKVLVFTGHHWVRHGEKPGSIHPMSSDGRPIKTKGIDLSRVMSTRIQGMRLDLVSYTARLIVVSGCYTLIKKSAAYFHETFPNATVLGFFGSATRAKGVFYERFLERLPARLDVDSETDVKKIVDVWKQFIEDVNDDQSLWKGGSSDPTTRKPGYLLPDGTVQYWDKPSRAWKGFSVSQL